MRQFGLEEEVILTIVIQIVTWFLILSATIMFIKHSVFHTLDNLLDINILVSSAGFMIADWALFIYGILGCEMFTFIFFVFGSAGTYTTTTIAFDRYRKMMRMSAAPPDRKRQVVKVAVVWMFSVALIIYPAFHRISETTSDSSSSAVSETEFENLSTEEVSSSDFCEFTNNLIYSQMHVAILIAYIICSLWIPIATMLFCYSKIFKHVRSARRTRWLNHMAAQRSRQTAVIKCPGRKANVFQVDSAPIGTPWRNFDKIASRRERSILLKGVFSVVIVLVTWVPCTSMLISISSNGFEGHFMKYLRYAVILAKLSAPVNILHYICFSIRYKKLYVQTLLSPFKNILPCQYVDFVNNMMESQMVPSQTYKDTIVATVTSGLPVLSPITESPNSQFPSIGRSPGPDSHRSVNSRPLRKVLLRTKSMPMCPKRTGAIGPLPQISHATGLIP